MPNEVQHDARTADDALADAIRLVAHELLEPLVMAETYMVLVRERLDPAAHGDSRDDLEAAGRTLARARIVVEAILHDAVDRDRELVLRPVDLRRLAADCVRQIAPEIRARNATVRIGPLPVVNGDEALLGAVLKNLLLNGVIFGPPGGGDVELSAALREGSWRIAVASGGPALSEEDRAMILLPYRRGPGRERARGAGLGLAVCRRIVERHGGRLEVTSRPAGGNVFSFTLPAGGLRSPANPA